MFWIILLTWYFQTSVSRFIKWSKLCSPYFDDLGLLRHIFHVYFSLELSVSRHPCYNNMLQIKQNKECVNYVQDAWRLTRNSTGWVLTSHDFTGCIQDLTWCVQYERDDGISVCCYFKPVRWVNRSLMRLDMVWLTQKALVRNQPKGGKHLNFKC
jgi:hypothetical protein